MNDYREKLTLDEIAANDLEMTKDAVKNAKRHRFFNPTAALAFQRATVFKVLKSLGITINERTHPKMADKMMNGRGVKIETRAKYKGAENMWRNGIYIYAKGELVAFISECFVQEESPLLIHGIPDKYFVITNARV